MSAAPLAACAAHPPGLGYRAAVGISQGESPDRSDLPKAEFAFPGLLRDRLVAAILAGSKTSTTGLLADYQRSGEALPQVGDRSRLVDSLDRALAVLEVTAVRVVPLADVDIEHVRDEGEGYTTITEWRAAHERFWHSSDMRRELGDPTFVATDTTLVVLERFRVIAHFTSETEQQ
jgi:uncharacterized protein YhfF